MRPLVLRNFIIGGIGALALAGCATYPASTSPPAPIYSGVTAPPPGPNIYDTAPRASVHSTLLACANLGSNIGEVGLGGESTLYTPYIQTAAGALLRNPTEASCLSSGFGWRGAASGGGRLHNGLDLANPSGGFVYAAADGWVIANSWRGGYGLVLELDHGQGVRTIYAHLNEIDPNLAPRSFVSAGQPVARMGDTGNATGVHLHYEVSVDGLLVDPLRYGAPMPEPPIY